MYTNRQSFNPDAPAHYCICIQGAFESSWLEMLSGIWVISGQDISERHITTLVGHVADQAALLGVLNQLYNLSFALISVERMKDTPELRLIKSQGQHRGPSAQNSEDYCAKRAARTDFPKTDSGP